MQQSRKEPNTMAGLVFCRAGHKSPDGGNQAAVGREGSLCEFIELLQTKNSQAAENHRVPPRHTPKWQLRRRGVTWVDRQTGCRASRWGEEREKRDRKQKLLPCQSLSARN